MAELVDMLNDWEKKKQQPNFEAQNDLNILDWEEAKRKRKQREKKHAAKNRKRMQQRSVVKASSRSEFDSEDDIPLLPRRKSIQAVQRVVESSESEDVPLAQIRRRTVSQNALEENTTAKPRETAPSLDPGPVAQSKTENPLFVNPTQKSHADPFLQPSSLSEESEDSVMEDFRRNAGSGKSTNVRSEAEHSRARRQSLGIQDLANTSSTATNPAQTSKGPHDISKPRVAQPKPVSEASLESPTEASRPKPKISVPGRKLSSGDVAAQPKEQDVTPRTTASSRNAFEKPVVAKTKRTGPGSAAGPIKMVSKPVEPVRSEWNTTGKRFTTLKSMNSANKRDKRERAPDPESLQYVNAPSGFTSFTKARSAADTNVYGRRDSGRARVREDSDDEQERDPRILANWEQDKVPLICWEYRNNSCRLSDRQCRFLHRMDGYPIGPTSGIVPPKYRKPPISCWHYMENPIGCHLKAEQCDFAHYNTGWLASQPGTGAEPTKVDPSRRTKSDELLIEKAAAAAKTTIPVKTGKTCWYYMEDPKGCIRTAEECKYAHYNTGLLAAPSGPEITQIDSSRRPRSDELLLGQGVLPTCFFYMEDPNGCKRSADECHFAHYNTGLLAPPPGGFAQPTAIDRSRRPKSAQQPAQQPTKRPGFEPCFFWYMGYGCKNGDRCKRPHFDTGVTPRPPRGWISPAGEDLRPCKYPHVYSYCRPT